MSDLAGLPSWSSYFDSSFMVGREARNTGRGLSGEDRDDHRGRVDDHTNKEGNHAQSPGVVVIEAVVVVMVVLANEWVGVVADRPKQRRCAERERERVCVCVC